MSKQKLAVFVFFASASAASVSLVANAKTFSLGESCFGKLASLNQKLAEGFLSKTDSLDGPVLTSKYGQGADEKGAAISVDGLFTLVDKNKTSTVFEISSRVLPTAEGDCRTLESKVLYR